ncbi:MAG: caspase family protein [Desulfamplus sp.]|nr:caspase family protein [Desulfamplus sp.]
MRIFFSSLLLVICLSENVFSQKSINFEKRLALVIGNGFYNELELLDNAVNDAIVLSNKLKSLDFDITTLTDMKSESIRHTLDSFEKKIQPGCAVFFYFSGHGVQIDGHNYLVMSDFSIKDSKNINSDFIRNSFKKYSISLDEIMSILNKQNLKTKIVMLDACRKSPSEDLEAEGLAALDAPVNTLLAFATAPGKVSYSLTKDDKNSLYTKYLIQNIDKPNYPVDQMLKKVHKSVYEFSRQVSLEEKHDESLTQIPWINSSLIDDFYMKLSGPIELQGNEIGDTEFWYRVKDELNAQKIKQYITAYPNGIYTIEAKRRINDLSRQKITKAKESIKENYSFHVSKAESKSILDSPFFFSKLNEYLAQSANPVEEIKQGAKNGDALAMIWLYALSTHDRFKISQNLQELKVYCSEKEIQKTPVGLFLLGRAFFFGRGVDEDKAKAIDLIKKSASLGNPLAQNFLGDLLSEGTILTQNHKEAFSYYMMSAKKGYLPAIHNVALAYAEGNGVIKNDFEAVDWYKKAAVQGYAWSQNNLAVHYIKGLGISTDVNETLRLINSSVNQDNNQGKILLARLYETGIGVNVDLSKAKDLYNDVLNSASEKELKAVALDSLNRITNIQNKRKD